MKALTILSLLLVLGVSSGCSNSPTGLADQTNGVAGLADKPGPGDKQCIPGKQGSPKPGFKAGACSNQ